MKLPAVDRRTLLIGGGAGASDDTRHRNVVIARAAITPLSKASR